MSASDQVQHVVFTGNFSLPSGMAGTQRVLRLAEGLSEKNVVPSFIIDAKRIDESDQSADSFLFELSTFRSWQVFKQYRSLIKLYRVQCNNILYVYNSISYEQLLLVILAKWMGFSIVVDVVEDYTLSREKVSYFQSLRLRSMQVLETLWPLLDVRVVAISEYLKRKYADRFVTLYLPIMSNDLTSTVDTDKETIPYIAYAGGFGEKDGAHVLVKAFSELKPDDTFDYQLKLTGEEEKFKFYHPHLTYDTSRVRFVGRLSRLELIRFIQRAQILVVPRTNDKYAFAGFPFKLGEYLSTGNPVICSDLPEVKSYLIHKVDSLLVSPGDETDLSEKLQWAINHPVERRQIGLNGYKVWKSNFDTSLQVDRLIGFLESTTKE